MKWLFIGRHSGATVVFMLMTCVTTVSLAATNGVGENRSSVPHTPPASHPTEATVAPSVAPAPAPTPATQPPATPSPDVTAPPAPGEATRTSTITRRTPAYRDDSWFERAKTSGLEFHKTVHDILGDHLHVGIRSTSFDFTEEMSRVGQPEEDYFLGTIDELVDIQDEGWGNLTVGVYLNRNIGLEYHRDNVRAKTFTDSDDNHSDGDFVVKGRVISAVLRLPLDQILQGTHLVFDWPSHREGWEYDILARFVPYAGYGFEDLSGSFEAATWWANGYASPASWESLGSPLDTIRNGHVRSITVTSTDVGTYELYGIAIRILDRFYLDFSWSSVDVDLEAEYYLDYQYRATRTIPMSYETQNVGVRYFF